MPKSLDDNFRDWEADAFGYGYGSGEPHILPALKRFLELCPENGPYDRRILEHHLSPAVAWLLINILTPAGILEYGTSPRFGWLTDEGRALRAFVAARSADELVHLATEHDEDHIHCMHDACNCGPHGYEAGRVCQNPFWPRP